MANLTYSPLQTFAIHIKEEELPVISRQRVPLLRTFPFLSTRWLCVPLRRLVCRLEFPVKWVDAFDVTVLSRSKDVWTRWCFGDLSFHFGDWRRSSSYGFLLQNECCLKKIFGTLMQEVEFELLCFWHSKFCEGSLMIDRLCHGDLCSK